MENKETILKLYELFILNGLNSTPQYSEMLSSYTELREELEQSLTEEQKEKLQILEELQHNMNTEDNQQVFVEGFSVATKLIMESLNKDK